MKFTNKNFLILSLVALSPSVINAASTSQIEPKNNSVSYVLYYEKDRTDCLASFAQFLKENHYYYALIEKFKDFNSIHSLIEAGKNNQVSQEEVAAYCILILLVKWAQNNNNLNLIAPMSIQGCEAENISPESFFATLGESFIKVFKTVNINEINNLTIFIQRHFKQDDRNIKKQDLLRFATESILGFFTHTVLLKNKKDITEIFHSKNDLQILYKKYYPILQISLFSNWLKKLIS